MTYGMRRSGRRRLQTKLEAADKRADKGKALSPAVMLERYRTLAKSAALHGDPVAEEDYSQRAEHYYRMLQSEDV